MRFCLQPGCAVLLADPGVRRCQTHQEVWEAPRRARKTKLYGAGYRRARRRWARVLDAGHTVTCPRCGEHVDGRAWDLGHQDDGTLRPEHPTCNRGAHGHAETGP